MGVLSISLQMRMGLIRGGGGNVVLVVVAIAAAIAVIVAAQDQSKFHADGDHARRHPQHTAVAAPGSVVSPPLDDNKDSGKKRQPLR
jgi:hypothetical protein